MKISLLTIIAITAAVGFASTTIITNFNQPAYAEQCTTFTGAENSILEVCANHGRDPSISSSGCLNYVGCYENEEPTTDNREASQIANDIKQLCRDVQERDDGVTDCYKS